MYEDTTTTLKSAVKSHDSTLTIGALNSDDNPRIYIRIADPTASRHYPALINIDLSDLLDAIRKFGVTVIENDKLPVAVEEGHLVVANGISRDSACEPESLLRSAYAIISIANLLKEKYSDERRQINALDALLDSAGKSMIDFSSLAETLIKSGKIKVIE